MGLFDKFLGKNKKSKPNAGGTSNIDMGDRSSRQKILNTITDEKELAEVAKTNSMMIIRELALYKINDQTLLKEIYKENLKQERNLPEVNDRNVYSIILRKITDEEFLIDVAKSDIDGEIRSAAVGNLNFKDENLLIEIAKDDSGRYSNENMKIQALYKINDITVLQDVTEKYVDNPRITRIARERIEKLSEDMAEKQKLDQYVENDIASNIDLSQLKPEDLELLKNIKTADNPYSYEEEIKNVHDENILTYIFYNSSEPLYRRWSISNITDKKVILDAAMNDDDFDVRLKAIDTHLLSDEELFDIVTTDEVFQVVKLATENITDKQILNDIITHDLNVSDFHQVRQENKRKLIKEIAKERIDQLE